MRTFTVLGCGLGGVNLSRPWRLLQKLNEGGRRWLRYRTFAFATGNDARAETPEVRDHRRNRSHNRPEERGRQPAPAAFAYERAPDVEWSQTGRRQRASNMEVIMAADDKPKPDFSDVKSGGSSTAPSPPASKPSAANVDTYVVVAGDSLSKIAKRLYGDAAKWRQIYEANRDQIKNPDLIHPGQQLKIPR